MAKCFIHDKITHTKHNEVTMNGSKLLLSCWCRQFEHCFCNNMLSWKVVFSH